MQRPYIIWGQTLTPDDVHRLRKDLHSDLRVSEALESWRHLKRVPSIWYKEKEDHMGHLWIIDGEWSEYHKLVSIMEGWTLQHRDGMWQVVTADSKVFPTDDAARDYVLEHEHDPNSNLYGIAINAVVMGNIRGQR